jgi:hypothetical protein
MVEDKKKTEVKWKQDELAIGNTFSGTSYFKTTAESGNLITTRCQGKDITVGRDILES